MKIVVLIPAYNEAGSIGSTIEAVLAQTRLPDEIIVIPNGCSDSTAEIARTYPVTVLELPKLEHRKSEALNRGWVKFAQDADIVISHDADTVLPTTAVADWEYEFLSDELFGGSTSKFTVQQRGFLGRLQKAEYAGNIQAGLDRGWTDVLAGAGTAFSGSVLRLIASRPDRVGPWSYESAVEDYELTYRILEIGFRTVVSPNVRAYTDGMSTVNALWNQRVKWQAGTVNDLLRFGLNRFTFRMWASQSLYVFNAFARVLLLTLITASVMLDTFTIVWWVFLMPLLGVALSFKVAWRIPHRDWKDLTLALTILPMEFLQIIQGGWTIASWGEVVLNKVSKSKRDLWEAQYKAEGV